MLSRLSKDQLLELGNRIVERFYRDCEGGTQFGCDWPTMRVLFPRRVAMFRRLQAEYRSR